MTKRKADFMDTQDLLEARKLTSMAMKNEKFLENKEKQLEEQYHEHHGQGEQEESVYVPTSNLLQVRTVAMSSFEEELPPLAPPKEEKEVHQQLYGAAIESRDLVDAKRKEKKMDKHG